MVVLPAEFFRAWVCTKNEPFARSLSILTKRGVGLLQFCRCLSRIDESTNADDFFFFKKKKGVEKKKLKFGPVSCPTGLPASCFAPKTNLCTDLWITVNGDEAEFIKSRLRRRVVVFVVVFENHADLVSVWHSTCRMRDLNVHVDAL